jgi:uncharacterized protein
MHVRHPYQFDTLGRTADVADAAYVRGLIEQVLFTAPGERVNRPDFGTGVMQMVFAPNSEELAGATQFLIQSGLQQWLGDLITIDEADVTPDDAALRITIRYTLRATGESRRETFTRGSGA